MIGSYVRQAVRALGRERSFTFTAVVTLGLGMGATLAHFSVIEAVLLRSLPYRESERVVMLTHHDSRTGISKEFVAIGDVFDIALRNRSFDAVGLYGQGEAQVQGMGDPFRVPALFATPSIFDILGVQPALGRGFTADDGREGAGPVVVLGHTLWQERFGGDTSAIGRSIRVGPVDRVIVGVAPPAWRFPPHAETDLILSMPFPVTAPTQRRNWTLAMARLRPRVTPSLASAEVASIAAQLEREFPETNEASQYRVVPLREALVGNTKSALYLLFAAVAAVLLIAWANVANLVLVRALGRRREMAIRAALGAGRRRIAAHAIAESAVVGVAGASVGLVVAVWGAKAMVRLVPDSARVSGLADVELNMVVVGFALALTVSATIVFGLVGALQLNPRIVAGLVQSGLRTSAGKSTRRTASTIVCAEIAFAVLLLFGAGLVLRSFGALLAVDPGFDPSQVARIGVTLPAGRYDSLPARVAFYDRAFQSVAALPGVTAVGSAAITPLTGNNWTHPLIVANSPPPAGERPPEVGWQVASNGYFTSLRIPLVAGRLFDQTDQPTGRPVVIVSEALATRYFSNGDAVGQQVQLGPATAEVVGVVGSIRRAALTDEPRMDMYLPFERQPGMGTTLFVRTSGDPAAAGAAIGAALRQLEPQVLLDEGETLEQVAQASLAIPRLLLALLGLFAVIALSLAMIGIYGVTAYTVEQQAREIGTRIAFGARRRDIYRMVLGRGITLAIVGAGIGLVAALLGSRLLASMLYSTSTTDPLVAVLVVVSLLVVAGAACLVPARRAAGLDPARTLTGS